MTENQAEQILDQFLNGVTVSIGFTRLESLKYGRLLQDATAILSFPVRIAMLGVGSFTGGVGLRFESLEKWLSEDLAQTDATFGKPINLLRKDTVYTEWQFSCVEDLEGLREIILDDLMAYAIPYFNRYSSLVELRKTLESPDEKDWIALGLSVDTHVTTLAAIQMCDGDKVGAIRTLDNAIDRLSKTLSGRPHEFCKRSFEMKHLRNRICRNG